VTSETKIRLWCVGAFLFGVLHGLNDPQGPLKTKNTNRDTSPKKVLEPNEKFASHPTGSPQAEACLPANRMDMPCLPFCMIDKLRDAEPDPPPSNVSKEAQS
jgi:hypothetical protein